MRPLGLFILLGLAICTPLPAQEALVLSGGGSRGLAHVGVVVGLDSLGHDPELVVGVSMGAIIGALYAAGYSGDEIRTLVTQQDWRDLFKPQPLVLGAQRTVRLPSLHWSVQLGRFEFSRGFVPDWRANRTLVHLLFDASVRARGNFDRLPRRYRALASESGTGEGVVLARGDLARAVRASMAESGLFSPVEWDGRVLVDGGVTDYFPIGLAAELGGHPIIGSDVLRTERPAGRDPISMLRHAITLLIVRARADTTQPTHLIVPDLDPRRAGFTYPDDAEPLVNAGLAATLRVVPPRDAGKPVARAAALPPNLITRVVIETADSSLALWGRTLFRSAAGAPYATDGILRNVDVLYASAFTESVWPRVDSSATLTVRIDPRPTTTLDIATGYDNDRGGRIWAAVQRRASRLGAPTEFELAAATTGTERWVTMSGRRGLLRRRALAWHAGASLQETEARFVRVDDVLSTQEITRGGGWLGVEHRRVFPDHVLSFSVHAEQITVSDTIEGRSFGPLLRFSVPEPTRVVGVPLSLEVESRFGDVAYQRATFRASLRRDRAAFKLAAVADLAITDRGAPPDVLPALGDERAMPGFRWGEERGRARVVAGFDVAYPILLGGHARLRTRGGAAPRALRDLDDTHSWVIGSELAAVWSLPFASLLVGGGFNTRGRQRFDVVVGSLF